MSGNKPGLVKVEVCMREIAAFHDLTPGRVLVGPPEDPQLVMKKTSESFGLFRYNLSYTNQRGETVHGVDTELPGVYRSERVTGYAPFLRTFSRRQSRTIDQKYVYVFRADSKTGDGMSLLCELQFDQGRFAFCDTSQRGDSRPAGSDRMSKLILEAAGLNAPQGPFYFFYLAPHQLPWKAVEELTQTVVHRGMRLWDEFWTDGYRGGDPEDAQDFLQLSKSGAASGKLGFLMHLLDPLEEGLRRREVYGEALDRWHAEQQRLAAVPEFVLATKVDGLARINEDLYEHVSAKLPRYLSEMESKSFQLRFAAEVAASDLQRWIGERSMREAISFPTQGGPVRSDTWLSDGKRRYPSREDKGEADWVSRFSNLVGAYRLHSSDEEILEEVALAAGMVHDRLGESTSGQQWLEQLFEKAIDGKIPEDDGGAAFLFEAGRKGHLTFLEGTSHLLKAYAPEWTKKYRQDALKNLQNFMKAKYGIALDVVEPRSQRKYAKILRKTKRRVKARGLEHLKFDSKKTHGVKLTNSASKRVALAVELFNLSFSADAVRRSKDPWDALNAFGATIDAYMAATEVSKRIPTEMKFASGRALKFAPILVVISGVIDTVLATRDWSKSTNFGQAAGHALRAVGSLLTVGGAVASESGIGVLVAILGLALQSIGSYIVANFSEVGLFLQYCQWGTPGLMSQAATAISSSNKFGFKGELKALKTDVQAQLHAIDELTFDFEPAWVFEEPDSVMLGATLALRSGLPLGFLGDEAKWTVHVDVYRTDLGDKQIKSWDFEPDDHVDHLDFTVNQPVTVLALAPEGSKDDPATERAEGKILASGTMKLDIDGTGKRILERVVDPETFRMTYWASAR